MQHVQFSVPFCYISEPSEPQEVGASAIDAYTVIVMWKPPKNPNGNIVSYIILYSEDVTQPEAVWNMTERNGKRKNNQ